MTRAPIGPPFEQIEDRIRNEAGLPTIATGNITTSDDVNTILAAGRADLCVLELPTIGTTPG